MDYSISFDELRVAEIISMFVLTCRPFSFSVSGRSELELYFTTGFPVVKLTKLEEYSWWNARS